MSKLELCNTILWHPPPLPGTSCVIFLLYFLLVKLPSWQEDGGWNESTCDCNVFVHCRWDEMVWKTCFCESRMSCVFFLNRWTREGWFHFFKQRRQTFSEIAPPLFSSCLMHSSSAQLCPMISSSYFVPEMPNTEQKKNDVRSSKKKNDIYLCTFCCLLHNSPEIMLNVCFLQCKKKKSCLFGKFPAKHKSVGQAGSRRFLRYSILQTKLVFLFEMASYLCVVWPRLLQFCVKKNVVYFLSHFVWLNTQKY